MDAQGRLPYKFHFCTSQYCQPRRTSGISLHKEGIRVRRVRGAPKLWKAAVVPFSSLSILLVRRNTIVNPDQYLAVH